MAVLQNRWSRLTLLLALFNIILFSVFVVLRLSSASDGMRLQPGTIAVEDDGVILTPIDLSDNAVSGGKLVAVNSRSVDDWAGLLLCWQPFCAAPERMRWEVGDTLTYQFERAGELVEEPVTLHPYPLLANLRQDWGAVLYALTLLGVGVFVFFKRPDEPATRILLLAGSSMVGATSWSFGFGVTDFIHPLTFWIIYFSTRIIYLFIMIGLFHFTLVFPRPHRLVERYRWLVPTIYILPFAVHILTIIGTGLAATGPLDWFLRIGLDQNITVLIYLLLALPVIATNYRDQTDTVSRQQIRVVVYAILVIQTVAVVFWQLPEIISGGEQWMTSNMTAIVGLLMPLALAISIMRYRLWEIDTIINRTAVYGLLTVIIAGLYIAVVGTLGALFQGQTNLVFSLIATGIAAVIFQPLLERLQRFVNRLMYGERDDPYQVLSLLGRQLQSTLTPEDLLGTITETIAHALKLPYAGISILNEGTVNAQTEYGKPQADCLTLPLVYQNEQVGNLTVAQRGSDEPFTPPDLRLLDDISRQAGVVAHAARLNMDLRRSREKLVTTREEERRRLRRDLHDGLGPTLASHTLKLDVILDSIDSEPARAKQLTSDLKVQTQETIADIRRLVYDLRPPTLDELGLIEALRSHILNLNNEQADSHITLEVLTERMPELSAALEVAAYRITLEALTNVLRHANAKTCHVCVSIDQHTLKIEIEDDGVGVPAQLIAGVGITSMRERAVELGGMLTVQARTTGGTQVIARLPLGRLGS